MEEAALGIEFFDERNPAAEHDEYWDRDDLEYPDEEYVIRLAGLWSVNPQTLEQRGLHQLPSWTGAPSW